MQPSPLTLASRLSTENSSAAAKVPCTLEFGRLLDGCKTYNTPGTHAIQFMCFSDVPQDRIKDITCIKLVVADCPFKEETKRVRATTGGDRINYPQTVSSKTTELQISKLLFNYTVSTPGACFLTPHIKDFFLSTPKWNVLSLLEFGSPPFPYA